MSPTFSWPDLVIGGVLALAAFKGFRSGFVKELGGLVALAALLIAPHYYNGLADGPIDHYTKLGSTGAHLVGTLLTGIVAYAIVLVITSILSRIAKLPILGIGNAIAGGIIGFCKGAVLIWVVLFVALFFPLTPAVRSSLHTSRLAPYFVMFDGIIDGAIESTIPTFARSALDPYFTRHHL